MDAVHFPTPVAALLRELDRICGRVEDERAAADQAVIRGLQHEVAELRRAVAHLRAAARPLPSRLQPVVARAVLAAEADRVAPRPLHH
jgi:uncharacterized coiled-coil protein SlyX